MAYRLWSGCVLCDLKVTGLNRLYNQYTQTLACPVQNNLVWSETDALKLCGTVKKLAPSFKTLKCINTITLQCSLELYYHITWTPVSKEDLITEFKNW